MISKEGVLSELLLYYTRFNGFKSISLHIKTSNPARRGQKWEKEDDEKLWNLLMQKTTINELASNLQRSKKSIIYRLKKLQEENPMQENLFIEYNKVFSERL